MKEWGVLYLDFNIYKLNTDKVFFLPDIGCIQLRDRINNYINPHIQEVAILGIPLTDKVFMFACSKKIDDTSSSVFQINDPNSEFVNEMNLQLYNAALKTVATSDQEQLSKIVNTIKGCV